MFKFLASQQARLSTLKRWSLLSGQVAGMQVLVQGVSAITGLLLIRALPKEEYAWFTLAASMLATLNLLADGGLTTALTSIGGRVYQDVPSFSRLLAEGRRLAWRLGFLGALLATPFFWHLYARLESPPATTVWLIGLVLLATVPVVTGTLLTVPCRLHSRAGEVQLAELLSAGVRLLLTLGLLGIGWIEARGFFAVTLLAATAQAVLLKRRTQAYTAPEPAGPSHSREMRGFVRALYANYLFFCVQGQVTTWIIGWLAGAQQLADLGALSRLAVLFAALGAPFAHLVTPSLARIQDPRVLRRRFALALGVVAVCIGLLLAAAWWRPQVFLWLLGTKYAHLSDELLLALAAQGLSLASGVCWGLIVVRGWVRHAWATIGTALLGYACGAAFFPLDQVWGLLAFSIASNVPTLLFCLAVAAWKMTREPMAPKEAQGG